MYYRTADTSSLEAAFPPSPIPQFTSVGGGGGGEDEGRIINPGRWYTQVRGGGLQAPQITTGTIKTSNFVIVFHIPT